MPQSENHCLALAAPASQPRVLVSGSRRSGRFSWWGARAMAWAAGAEAIRVRPGDAMPPWRTVHAVVLGGGADIDPDRYGEVAPAGARLEPARDDLEWELLTEALERGLPLLGICRGAQMLNVWRGGTLHQDLTRVYAAHSPRWTLRAKKAVSVKRQSQLADALGVADLRVNSIHRQGMATLGEGLEVSARDALGVVQGIEDPRRDFCVGVQWHPELLPWLSTQRGLFDALVQAARRARRDAPLAHSIVGRAHVGPRDDGGLTS